MKVMLMIPAYNEAENLEKLISKITDLYPQYEYVIINDGSTDHTENLCREHGFRYISLPVNLGIGGAVQTGYRYALEKGADIAVQIDGDGQHDIGYIDDVIAPIISGEADVVIGSRFVGGKQNEIKYNYVYFRYSG